MKKILSKYWEKMKNIFSKYWWILLVISFLAGVGRMVVLYRKGYVWADWSNLKYKSIWMILDLLIVPFTLAIFVYILNRIEKKIESDIKDDNQRERLFQNYFDSLIELILDKRLKVSAYNEVREITRIKTLSTLNGLDEKRISNVIKFLEKAELIQEKDGENPIISLNEAILEGATLMYVNLKGAYLVGANLKSTILNGANLEGANLEGANLEGADLNDAYLVGANLKDTRLNGANLEGANLRDANLKGGLLIEVNLNHTTLAGATMPDGKVYDPKIHTIKYLTGKKREKNHENLLTDYP